MRFSARFYCLPNSALFRRPLGSSPNAQFLRLRKQLPRIAFRHRPNGRTTTPCYSNGGQANVRDDIGQSSYDSLQVQLERRMSKGWQYRAAYTFSRTKDNGEGAFDSIATRDINFIEPFSRSRLDFPNVLSFETVYELPFGRGRTFGSDMSKAADYFIGGWQLNAIFRTQSGQPFDVRRDGVRVDVNGDPYGGPAGQYLRPAAFTAAPAGRFGNLERNGLRGPSTKQLNLGLTKNVAIYEKWKVQLRAEFINLTNTSQLTPPNTDVNNTSTFNGFGTIRSTYGFTNRQIQLGARIEF